MLLNDIKINKGSASVKKVVNYRAELAHENFSYSGFIGNLTEDSIYMITFPSYSPVRLAPGTMLQLKLALPSKESICLQCRVAWSYKTPRHGLTQSIGLDIIDSFPNYRDLLNDLF